MSENAPENGKKRRGRRSYLSDFQADENGKYSYRGSTYVLDTDKKGWTRFRILTAVGALAALLIAAAQECFPPVEMSRSYITLLPWLFQLVAAFTVVWAEYKMLAGGSPLREYVYEKSAAKLPQRALLCAIFSFICAADEILFICINGFGESVFYTTARPVLALINGAVCVSLYLLVKKAHWIRIQKSSGQTEVVPDPSETETK